MLRRGKRASCNTADLGTTGEGLSAAATALHEPCTLASESSAGATRGADGSPCLQAALLLLGRSLGAALALQRAPPEAGPALLPLPLCRWLAAIRARQRHLKAHTRALEAPRQDEPKGARRRQEAPAQRVARQRRGACPCITSRALGATPVHEAER